MDFNVKQTASTKRKKISNSKGFTYDDPSHTYTLNGVKLKSSTSLISEYSGDFASIAISNRVATSNKKKGIGITDAGLIRKYWKLKGTRAASLGTTGHDFCVMYWLDRTTEPITRIDINAKKLMDKVFESFRVIRMEIPKANKTYLMGYTVDMLLEHIDTGDIYLTDFKYSQAFTAEQYKNLKGRLPKKLKEPFENLRDCGFDKGKIQMNMYKKFLADEGYKVSKIILFHIDGLLPNGESHYGDKGYKAYVVEDLSSQVETMLEPHRNPEVQNVIGDEVANIL